MKVSNLTAEQLKALPIAQIGEIVFGDYQDDGLTGDAALLLGGPPYSMPERAQAAAALYLAGRVPRIIPTGGVKWDTDKGHMSEAEYMALLLEEAGVPREAIILENEATTTRENMVYGTVQLERSLRMRGSYRVYIVSSPCHIRRSVALAHLFLPRTAKISGYAAHCPQGVRETWHLDAEQANDVYWELNLLGELIREGEIEDIEFLATEEDEK